jgi:hypothetical protein
MGTEACALNALPHTSGSISVPGKEKPFATMGDGMAWENWEKGTPKGKLAAVVGSAIWVALLILGARFLDLEEPYLPLAIAGGFVFYLRNQLSSREMFAWAVISLSLGLVVHFPGRHDWVVVGSDVMALFGIGAFLMMGLRWLWSGAQERRRTLATFAPAAALFFFVFSAQRALSLANILYPRTYDLYLYAFDGSFGFQPSFLAGKALAASSVLRVASVIAYISLPFVMALVYALRLSRGAERPSWDLITMFMLAGFGGWVLYNIVPATGPIHAFGADFPWRPLPYASLPRLFLEMVPVPTSIPRNAIPSLHMAWVILLFWSSAGLSRLMRYFLIIYLGLTFIATMGTGEHYFVDLVAAVPFALLIFLVVSPHAQMTLAQRLLPAGYAFGMTMMWLLLARFGVKWMLISPILPWALVLATLAVVWLIKPVGPAVIAAASDAGVFHEPEAELVGTSGND